MTAQLFSLDGEQIAFRSRMRKFAVDKTAAFAAETDRAGQYSWDAFKALQSMVAEARVQVEAARTPVYRARPTVDADDPYGELSALGAMAKCFAADVVMKVTTECVQLLGGHGYTNDFPVERMKREAKITQISEGTNRIQRTVSAKQVLG